MDKKRRESIYFASLVLFSLRTEPGQQLRCLSHRLAQWQIEGTLRFRQGEPEWQIRWEVMDRNYDLIVIGAEPYGRWPRLLMAEEVLPHAVTQAENFQAELILLKVLEPLAKHHIISLEAAWRAEKATRELAREYLERVATDVRERGVSVRVITIEGNPHEGIVSCAEAEQVEWI